MLDFTLGNLVFYCSLELMAEVDLIGFSADLLCFLQEQIQMQPLLFDSLDHQMGQDKNHIHHVFLLENIITQKSQMLKSILFSFNLSLPNVSITSWIRIPGTIFFTNSNKIKDKKYLRIFYTLTWCTK